MRLGFLASHNGSNVRAIVDEIKGGRLNARVGIVISNNENGGVLRFAEEAHVSHIYLETERVILEQLQKHGVSHVVLAGYVKMVGSEILNAYQNRILNIHPALIPKHCGKGMYGIRVHESVIKSGDDVSGATVHLVDEEYDHGRILGQLEVRVFPEDDAKSLSERVLAAEHVLYSQVLREIQEGRIDLDYSE